MEFWERGVEWSWGGPWWRVLGRGSPVVAGVTALWRSLGPGAARMGIPSNTDIMIKIHGLSVPPDHRRWQTRPWVSDKGPAQLPSSTTRPGRWDSNTMAIQCCFPSASRLLPSVLPLSDDKEFYFRGWRFSRGRSLSASPIQTQIASQTVQGGCSAPLWLLSSSSHPNQIGCWVSNHIPQILAWRLMFLCVQRLTELPAARGQFNATWQARSVAPFDV